MLAGMDDHHQGCVYRYCHVGNRDPSLLHDTARRGHMAGSLEVPVPGMVAAADRDWVI